MGLFNRCSASLLLALAIAASTAEAAADPQIFTNGELEEEGATEPRQLAGRLVGETVEISTPLGPVMGKTVFSTDGENKHIQERI